MPSGSWQQERSGLWSLRSKRQLLPIADLNADGDAIDWLTIPWDIMPTLSVLVGDDGQATHTVKTDTSGRAIIAGMPAGPTTTPVITGSYPILLASWTNATIAATANSPTFDARPYQSIIAQIVVTAISGAGASVTLLGETQEPVTNTWWSGLGITAITAISTARADGSIIPTTGTLGVPSATGARLSWPISRITLLVAGTTPSITLSAYVWGF